MKETNNIYNGDISKLGRMTRVLLKRILTIPCDKEFSLDEDAPFELHLYFGENGYDVMKTILSNPNKFKPDMHSARTYAGLFQDNHGIDTPFSVMTFYEDEESECTLVQFGLISMDEYLDAIIEGRSFLHSLTSE